MDFVDPQEEEEENLDEAELEGRLGKMTEAEIESDLFRRFGREFFGL